MLGHVGIDYGPDGPAHVDYPDYAAKVARAVSAGNIDRGVLICGTGVGMCIVANKFAGVRAAPCHDDLTAEMSRLHNDANVLCLSADLLGDRLVNRMVEIWLGTRFEGGRHARRLAKIAEYEQDPGFGSHLHDGDGSENPFGLTRRLGAPAEAIAGD